MSAGRTGGADPSLLPLRAAEKPLETQGPLHPSGVPHRERPLGTVMGARLSGFKMHNPLARRLPPRCAWRGAAGRQAAQDGVRPLCHVEPAPGPRGAGGHAGAGRTGGRRGSPGSPPGEATVGAGRALAGHSLPRGSEFTPAGAGDPEQGRGHSRPTARTCSVSPRRDLDTLKMVRFLPRILSHDGQKETEEGQGQSRGGCVHPA